ncbi:hypothetical protein DL93DRAFT_2170692 [Clavulina sp. PMI_390]|nr:hypothetical protein DL93DRAFT_2170692 [Clavulina sp. PMI_390]
MFADRTTDFLWASLILGVFFAREKRLAECSVVAGATARFAIACGLDLPNESLPGKDISDPSEYLLPPANDGAEADDRTRLAKAIYVGVQSVPLMWDCAPILPHNDDWSPVSEEACPGNSDIQASRRIAGVWRSEVHLRVSVTNTYHKAMRFARSVGVAILAKKKTSRQLTPKFVYNKHTFFQYMDRLQLNL